MQVDGAEYKSSSNRTAGTFNGNLSGNASSATQLKLTGNPPVSLTKINLTSSNSGY